MKKNVSLHLNASEIVKQHKWKKRWNRVVTALSGVVVCSTVLSMMVPGITLSREAYCGYEEHPEHTDACYSYVKTCPYGSEADRVGTAVLICGMTESGAQTQLICGQVEGGHVHTDDCYTFGYELVCGQAEHIHTEDCLDQTGSPICGMEEHIHNESCYQQVSILTCSELGHVHDESCYAYSESEHYHTEECYHVHTDACFEKTLTCTLPLHTHELQCYSNPEKIENVYSWEQEAAQVKLTGKWSEDLLTMAKSQMGYKESDENYEVDENGKPAGYTRYGHWYGERYGDWCAMFISWCMNYIHMPQEYFPYESSTNRWVEALSSEQYQLFHGLNEEYIPQVGDLQFIDWDEFDPEHPEERVVDHVGIISQLVLDEDGTIKEIVTIEGNIEDEVMECRYLPTDSRIYGYASIPENPNYVPPEENSEELTEENSEEIPDEQTEEPAEEPAEELPLVIVPECDCDATPVVTLGEHYEGCTRKWYAETLSREKSAEEIHEIWKHLPEDIQSYAQEIMTAEDPAKLEALNALLAAEPHEANGSDGTITTTIDGNIPENATATVKCLDEGTTYVVGDYVGSKVETNSGSTITYALDIGLYEEGEKVELGGESVSVTVSGLNLGELYGDNVIVNVYHVVDAEETDFTNNAQNEHEVVTLPASVDADGNITFETDGFSVFYFTVDFKYLSRTFSMPGESSMLLSELLTELQVSQGVANVASVEFSNYELLQVIPVYAEDMITIVDWTLQSLQPFTSDEALTVTYQNGQVLTVLTTDELGTYWKKVDSLKANSQFLIVYTDPNTGKQYALTYGTTAGTELDIQAYGDYYVITNTVNTMQWTRVSNGFETTGATDGYLTMAGQTSLFGTAVTTINCNYNSTTGFWSLQRGTNAYYLHATVNASGDCAFSRTNSASNITIYQHSDHVDKTTYWNPVDEITDTNANYLICKKDPANENSYLVLGSTFSSNPVGDTIIMNPVDGSPGTYSVILTSDYFWKFSNTGSSSRQTNSTNTASALSLSTNGSPIASGNGTTNTLTYEDGTWTITNGAYYLAANSSMTGFECTNSPAGDAEELVIFRQYTNETRNFVKLTGSLTDTGSQHLLVNHQTGLALGVNSSGQAIYMNVSSLLVHLTGADANTYTGIISDEYLWNFSSTSGRYTTNVAHPGYCLNLTNTGTNFISSSTANTQVSFNSGYFTIRHRPSSGSSNNYLRLNNNSNGFTVATDGSTAQRYFDIYKVTNVIGEMDIPDLLQKTPDHYKYIDAFRDEEDNPDTDLDDKIRNGTVDEDIFDMYRLYLDIGPESSYDELDMLFVLDSSTSMDDYNGYDAVDILGNTAWRSYALDSMMNGQATAPGTTTLHQPTLYDNGILKKIAYLNPRNKVAAIRFSENAAHLDLTAEEDANSGWVQASKVTKGISWGENVSGTNYVDGLRYADQLLQQSDIKNDGKKKIVVFVSDGRPTYYYPTLTTGDKGGSGSEDEECQNATSVVIDEFTTKYAAEIASGQMYVYAIGVGTNNLQVLDQLATSGQSYSSTDFSDIMKLMETSLTLGVGYYSALNVTDTLSDAVDFYTDQLDFKVELVSKYDDSAAGKTLLYSGQIVNGALQGTYTSEGLAYLQTDGVSLDLDSKTIQVKYRADYVETGGTVLRASFNVKTTKTAYDDYIVNSSLHLGDETQDGYLNTVGDWYTDYPGVLDSSENSPANETSARKGGFKSNAFSNLDYRQTRTGYTGPMEAVAFSDPVVQVNVTPKEPVTAEPNPTISKTIDYLGDGVTNPDTDEAGNKSYRLYLDVTMKDIPIDLVVAVDGSASMVTADVDGTARYQIVQNLLNGSGSEEGFISHFLSLNDDNRISVIQFYGESATVDSNLITEKDYAFGKDSRILLDWTDTAATVTPSYVANSGTDYEAGLNLATYQFDKVRDSGHKQMLLFISDGVPTYFLIDPDDEGTAVNGYTLTESDVSKRFGNGSDTDASNYAACVEPTKQGVDDFLNSNENVSIIAVSVGSDLYEGAVQDNRKPVVLEYMATASNGAYVDIKDSAAGSLAILRDVCYPKNVVITDTLTKYVRLDTGNATTASDMLKNADVLVTRKSLSTGIVEELFKDGALTTAGNGILDATNPVTYTAQDTATKPTSATGTVSLNFISTNCLEPDYVYTISFNVKTTKTASEALIEGTFTDKGDAGTDYGSNTTSSGKDGFYSNVSANLTYTIGGDPHSMVYDKPVVQAEAQVKYSLSVKKVVSGVAATDPFPFELTVLDDESNPVDLSLETLPEGVTLKSGVTANNVLLFSLSYNQEITLEDILPEDAKLTLRETSHDGFYVSMKIGDNAILAKDENTFDLNEDMEVIVTNTAGTTLPSTGGSGTEVFTRLGIAVIAIGLGALLLTRRKKGGD